MDVESAGRPKQKRSVRILTLWVLMATVAGIASLLLLGSTSSHDASKGNHFTKRDLNINPYSTNLTARSDRQEQTPLEELIVKGNWLACLLNARPEHISPQDPFTLWTQLAENGWDGRGGPYTDQDEMDDQGFFVALTELIGNDGTQFDRWMVMQHDHAATRGQYENHYNRQDGVIIAKWNFGPVHQKEKFRLTAAVPRLAQWSDIVYIDWLKLGGTNYLKYIIRTAIVNKKTKDTVTMVARDAGHQGELPEWPGWQFPFKSDHAKALLATPNGAGVAYFLSQHKRRLGIKVPDVIGAFLCNPADLGDYDEDEMCLYFRLVDGPVSGDHI